MSSASATAVVELSPEFAAMLRCFTASAAAEPDVRAAVEANHDNNRWWPAYVRDWRVRMAVAGWSSRISYAMVSAYSGVVARADKLGWDGLTALDDQSLTRLIYPLGLTAARIRYLRSLATFIDGITDLATAAPDELITSVATQVSGAGYNTAQCAVLYACGYHCGVIPVDSGMVTKLSPLMGIKLPAGPAAYEHMRKLLQRAVITDADSYRDLAADLGYQVAIPRRVAPTWFVHLVLIYFKRLYLNRPMPELCPRRPACPALLRCSCQHTWAIR